ncbi:hypothetical protein V8E54_013396 [Elaphomyces granulatus]|jgi:hypothetical protein
MKESLKDYKIVRHRFLSSFKRDVLNPDSHKIFYSQYKKWTRGLESFDVVSQFVWITPNPPSVEEHSNHRERNVSLEEASGVPGGERTPGSFQRGVGIRFGGSCCDYLIVTTPNQVEILTLGAG